MKLKQFKERFTNKQKIPIIILGSLVFIFLFMAIYQSFATFKLSLSETIIDAKVGKLGTIITTTFMANGATLSTPTGCVADGANQICTCEIISPATSCTITLPTITRTGNFVVIGYNTSSTDGTTISGWTSGATERPVDTNETYHAITVTRDINFAYTGAVQNFTAPHTGTYQIQLWGAGTDGSGQSQGGYTRGNIELTSGTALFIYVGGIGSLERPLGESSIAGWNGGGVGFSRSTAPASYPGRGGNGATDIRLTSGAWNNADSLRSRIMVAGGGGGGAMAHNPPTFISGSFAGGLIGHVGSGHNGIAGGSGGSQTAGNQFGVGGNGTTTSPIYFVGAPGGGGGYWGGNRGNTDSEFSSGAGGGSSFISGHTGAVAVVSASSNSPRTNSTGGACATGTTDNVCSRHYSGRVFTNTVMIDGLGRRWTNVVGTQLQMPRTDGTLYPLGQGHNRNGYARITRIS